VADIEWNADQFMIAAENAVYDALETVGVHLADKLGDTLNRQSSNKSNGGSPSAPGEPPAKDTGTLARSISYMVNDNGTLDVGVAKQSPANKYALVMEYGSRGPIKPKKAKALHWKDKNGKDVFARQVVIQARPWLRPTVAIEWKNLPEIFSKSMKRSLPNWLWEGDPI